MKCEKKLQIKVKSVQVHGAAAEVTATKGRKIRQHGRALRLREVLRVRLVPREQGGEPTHGKIRVRAETEPASAGVWTASSDKTIQEKGVKRERAEQGKEKNITSVSMRNLVKMLTLRYLHQVENIQVIKSLGKIQCFIVNH